jgi:hypothetical protein
MLFLVKKFRGEKGSVRWFVVVMQQPVQVYLWMLQCGNIILLTLGFLVVAKFTTIIHYHY